MEPTPSPLDQDRLLGRVLVQLRAVDAAVVDAALADEARRLAAGEAARLAELLVGAGSLTPEQLRDSLGDRTALPGVCGRCGTIGESADLSCCPCGGALIRVDAGDTLASWVSPPSVRAAAVTVGPSSQAVSSASADAEPVGAPFGRYRLTERLGAGGMGVVWKAWDPVLGRAVALKQILSGADDPAARARFLREARLSARLRHPGLVAVHDLGEVAGVPYLTLELIAGGSFEDRLAETRDAKRAGERIPEGPLGRDVETLAQVAEAIAHAHAHGVLHRDLKPANVLIDGAGRARVTDFGLAREIAGIGGAGAEAGAAPLTLSSERMGTPAYMSPEQARGDAAQIGPRTDVYALGAILYEVLTGATLFEGKATLARVYAILETDASAPRRANRHVPPALEAVCLRALEKEPARRYPNAGAVAAELRRWLGGEPVEARPPSAWGRAWRRLVRNRVVAGAVASVALLSGWGVAAELRSARLENERLAALRRAAGAAVAGALEVRRLGLLAAMETHRPGLLRAQALADRELGLRAPQPSYCRARFERAALSDDAAEAWVARALAADADYAPALYERALLRARAAAHRLAEARRQAVARLASAERGGAGAREPTIEELEAQDETLRALRSDTLAALERLKARLAAGDSGGAELGDFAGIGPARVACIEGLLAAYSAGDRKTVWAAARAALDRAIAIDPGLEEAHEALATAAIRFADPDTALAACTRGLESDRGYLPLLLARAEAHAARATQDERSGKDSLPGVRAAANDYAAVIELAPGRSEGWSGRGRARHHLGGARMLRGEDASGDLRAAIEDFSRALDLEPGSAELYAHRGRAHWTTAVMYELSARDPSVALDAAISDLDRALALEPRLIGARRWRAATHVDHAQRALERGGDPFPAWTAALADYDAVLAQDPLIPGVWAERSAVRLTRGDVLARRGGDPQPDHQAAAADATRALDLEPADSSHWMSRGKVHLSRATSRANRGEEAVEDFAAAVGDMRAALERNEQRMDHWLILARTCDIWGAVAAAHGKDPSTPWGAAEEAYGRAIAIHPKLGQLYAMRAELRLQRAQRAAQTGASAGEFLAGAEDDCGRALAIDPRSASAYAARARAHLAQRSSALAVRNAAGAREARRRLELAIADLQEAVRLEPGDASTMVLTGRLCQLRAQEDLAAGGDPGPDLGSAVAWLDRALALEAGNADAWKWRGAVHRDLAARARARGEDAGPQERAALADWEESLRRNPAQPDVQRWIAETREGK